MKKKLIGILLCMLKIATVPIAAGINNDVQEDQEKDGILSRTVVRGFILSSNVGERSTSFFALRVHYTTYNLFGEEQTGVLMLKRVTFTGKFTGHLGNFYIAGTFRGDV